MKSVMMRVIYKLNSLSESKKYDFLYNLFESGYLYSLHYKFLHDFLENLDHTIYRKIFDVIITKFMEKWEKQDYNVDYLFKSKVLRTLNLLNESKHPLTEDSLKDEVIKLIDKKIPSLTIFLYLWDFLEDLSSKDLVNIFKEFSTESLSDVFIEIFKFRNADEEYDWMLRKFENLGDIGFKIFENAVTRDINWEIKEDLFNRITRVHGLDYFKKIISRLLNDNNPEAIKLLVYSELGHEINNPERFALLEQTPGNILDLFAIAIKENEYLAEFCFRFFYEDGCDINKALIPFLKTQIIRSFKEKNLDTISFLTQFKLIYCFSDDELIELINDPDLGVVSSLIITSAYPPLVSYRFYDIDSTLYVLQYLFTKLFSKVGELLKKELIRALKFGTLDFLRLFIEFSFYTFQEDAHDHFYEYLDENDYKLLFNECDSKFKKKLIKILQAEQKKVKKYLITINFLIWLNKKIGEDYIDDVVNNFRKISPENFNNIFSSIINHLSGPRSAQKLKKFVERYYIPFKEDNLRSLIMWKFMVKSSTLKIMS